MTRCMSFRAEEASVSSEDGGWLEKEFTLRVQGAKFFDDVLILQICGARVHKDVERAPILSNLRNLSLSLHELLRSCLLAKLLRQGVGITLQPVLLSFFSVKNLVPKLYYGVAPPTLACVMRAHRPTISSASLTRLSYPW